MIKHGALPICLQLVMWLMAGLEVRRGERDILEIIFLLIQRKHICDPSLEPSRQDGSNEGSQHMYSWKNKETDP